MPDFDPRGLGARLKAELDQTGLDVRALQKALVARTSARGTSYASVWSYVNGQAPQDGPRPEVVEAMADVFGVLPEYLLHGGPRTAAEAEIVEGAAEEEGGFYRRLREELPDLERLDPSVTLALMTLVTRFLTASQRSGKSFPAEEVEERMVAYLQSVWAFMWQPLVAWGEYIGREPPVLDHGALNDYFAAMCHAQNLLLTVVAPPGLTPEEVATWPESNREEDTEDA